MARLYKRIIYVNHEEKVKNELAEVVCKLILERSDSLSVTSLKSLLSSPLASLNHLEKWARAHGPDSLEIRPSLKASAVILEGSVDVGLTWQLTRSMTNKSPEEITEMAASLLGKADTCEELSFMVSEQCRNPKGVDSGALVLTGDLKLVSGALRLSSTYAEIIYRGTSVGLSFNGEWLKDNGALIDGRDCELLGRIIKLNPLQLQCLAIWA